MAFEASLQHYGAALAGADYRNSTLSGTTHTGPSGSPQYQAVRLSTVADNTVLLTTVSGQIAFGILQNKPNTGEAADVGIFGVSKAVAGATSVAAGVRLMVDSSGCLIAYASAADKAAIGIALTTPAAAGEIFSAAIYGFGGNVGSIA